MVTNPVSVLVYSNVYASLRDLAQTYFNSMSLPRKLL